MLGMQESRQCSQARAKPRRIGDDNLRAETETDSLGVSGGARETEGEAWGRCVMPRLVQCIQIWCNRVPSGQSAADSMCRLVEDSKLNLEFVRNIYKNYIIHIIELFKFELF